MAVVHRFGGPVGGAYGAGDVPALSTYNDFTTGAVTLTGAQVVAGYGFGTPSAARNVQFPAPDDLFVAAKISAGAPCQLQFNLVNASNTAGNTYTATSPGASVTLATGANTAIAGGGAGVYILTFTNTASSSTAAYTVTRIS